MTIRIHPDFSSFVVDDEGKSRVVPLDPSRDLETRRAAEWAIFPGFAADPGSQLIHPGE